MGDRAPFVCDNCGRANRTRYPQLPEVVTSGFPEVVLLPSHKAGVVGWPA